ncbi:MAG: HEAT repeat domain-containing protein [Limnochordia bacterium]
MQDYIEKLITARGEELQTVAQRMARYGNDAVSAVDRLLNSRDRHLRLAGTLVLSHVNHPRAVPGLIHALGDEDNVVRLQAAAGLGRYRTRQARNALLSAFPDRLPSISVALLRSMENMMTPEMMQALRAVDDQQLAPRVRAEMDRMLTRSQMKLERQRTRPSSARSAPLATAPWLSRLPGGLCVGRAVPGLEKTVAAVLAWRLPGAGIIGFGDGLVRFTLAKTDMPQLVQVRLLQSVSLGLERNPDVKLTEDRNVIRTLYEFAHTKGSQSLLITGDMAAVEARLLGRRLGLRSARPPGYAHTLRLHVTEHEVFVEFLSPDDYPTVRNLEPLSRSLAACLAALSVSGARDTFCDPFCDDGSTVIERALLGPWAKAYGFVISASGVSTVRQAWGVLAPLSENPVESVRFSDWQQGRLPLEDDSVDAIASVLNREVLGTLEQHHVTEICRVLRPGGRMAFLSADGAGLIEQLQEHGLIENQVITLGEPTLGQIVVLTK